MVYESYIKSNKLAFIAEVKRISALLQIEPDWLMTVMYAESRVNEKAVNRTSGATGLIQFMPNTAIALGTTTEALKQMSNVEQLKYVYKYYAQFGKVGQIKSVVDLYKLTFFPVMVGKPADWVLKTAKTSAYTIAKQNGIIDRNKDGQITVAEFEQYVLSYLKKKIF